MILEQYYIECLSHASYLIGDETTGRAVVVDPRRDIGDYLADADRKGLTIEGVINTHFHADFVAGHLELVEATGAWIGMGEAAQTDYPIRRLADGEHIGLGEVDLEILATPGHTWESISVLVRERRMAWPTAILTGDALFIGDVGRPDLANLGDGSTTELARALYRSIHERLLALPDQVIVMPAHGAGSSCGKNLSTELTSTIGEQRSSNPSVQPMSEDEFVALVTEGQPAAPSYFPGRRGDQQARPSPPGSGAQYSASDPCTAAFRAAGRRAAPRCPFSGRLRGGTLARIGQCRLRRPVRRNGRYGHRDRGTDRVGCLPWSRAARCDAAGPYWFGQRHRLPEHRPGCAVSIRTLPLGPIRPADHRRRARGSARRECGLADRCPQSWRTRARRNRWCPSHTAGAAARAVGRSVQG